MRKYGMVAGIQFSTSHGRICAHSISASWLVLPSKIRLLGVERAMAAAAVGMEMWL